METDENLEKILSIINHITSTIELKRLPLSVGERDSEVITVGERDSEVITIGEEEDEKRNNWNELKRPLDEDETEHVKKKQRLNYDKEEVYLDNQESNPEEITLF